ncbi:hypothetical protein VTJ49DRAFT_5815 [Mycothermus thermophilus]|uniref:Uncharacterized protein n=1 Tax=Humicola insolens TaxID=85995 RepID=A0ABR3VQ71_HUMIN
MNFYAASNMPVYRVERESRTPKVSKSGPKPGKKSRFFGLQGPQRVTVPPPVRPVTASSPVPPDANSIDRLLEPAVGAPPSPETLRELNQQVRAASGLDKPNNQNTTPSDSSRRSLTSADRLSWENALEGRTISRNSSGRSTSSSMPSRDRPDSVQIFGKTIFTRKVRTRHESGVQSSSSSLYSTDAVIDPAIAPTSAQSGTNRDSTIPAIFNLRRNKESEAQRRPTISEPYNFRHTASRTGHDYTLDAQPPNPRRPSRQEDVHFADFSSDSLPLQGEQIVPASPELQQTAASRPRAQSVLKKNPSSSRRLLKRSQSQEHLRGGIPPPRPPRSPIDQSFSGAPAVPPRGSSRTSTRHERFDSVDRPNTSMSIRSPQLHSDAGSPPSTSYGLAQAPDMDAIPEHAYDHAPNLSRVDENWPLPSSGSATASASEQTLPNLIEDEDEDMGAARRSRASVASNSSLRGSQSVPMLRGSAGRRNSDASDTLGRFDLFAVQRALKEAVNESDNVLPREAWEDDIDYCYDHAAEANCDYEWGRASFEDSRDGDTATPGIDEQNVFGIASCEASPTMLTPAQFDVPALSPVSQLSIATAHEAITPTGVVNPKAANFSLPRAESKKKPDLLHVPQPSDFESFRESQAFSPSLLIPMDYQQQMLACEEERQDASSDFALRHHFDEPALNMDPSALFTRYRTSASTTGTLESASSAFDNKHNSTASSSTDYTRLTASVSSLDGVEPCPPVATTAATSDTTTPATTPATEPLQRFPSFEYGRPDIIGAMPTLPESEVVDTTAGVDRRPSASSASRPTRPPHFRSRGSESNLGRLAGMDDLAPLKTPAATKSSSSILKRGRARTASLSTPPPPNQYALFPSVQLTGNRI